MKNAFKWFEIPADDLDRAARFYERLFDVQLKRESMCGAELALFPGSEEGLGGCLCKYPEMRPHDNGTLVYLDAGDDLSPVLARVADAGGKVTMEKTEISPEIGYMALIIDSEGNRVGLHSPR